MSWSPTRITKSRNSCGFVARLGLALGITQASLAGRAVLTASAVSDYVRGRRKHFAEPCAIGGYERPLLERGTEVPRPRLGDRIARVATGCEASSNELD
jgi:hypothetical protein